MDMNFSAPVHQDPLLVLEIIDDAWAAETLPIEDIDVAPADLTHLDDEDPALPNDDDDEDKWNDLSLDQLTNTTSPDNESAHIDTKTPARTSNETL